MPKAGNDHTPSARNSPSLALATEGSPDALMRAADALDGAINNMVPDGGGGTFEALVAAERAIEERILALPAGDPHRLAWKLARLAEVLEAEAINTDDAAGARWQAAVARSCLADARALAGDA
jgi:hypothetical protein